MNSRKTLRTVVVAALTALIVLTIAAAGLIAQQQATEATLKFPLGVAIGPDGAIYFSERGGHRVRRIDPQTGEIAIVAGTGEPGFSGDGGPASKAQLRCPDSIDMDKEGTLYIADRCNQRIRRVDAATGIITTVAGNGERGTSPDGPALELSLNGPFYVRADSPGELIFTDTDANLVRRLDLRTGQVTTLAGTGERDFGGDGGPALKASFRRPHVALRTRNGDLIIGDSFNQRIRRVDRATGIIRTIAGIGALGIAEDGTPMLDAPFSYFGAIHELENGDLLFTEWVSGRLLRLDLDAGKLRVVAGSPEGPSPMAGKVDLLTVGFHRLADFVIDRQGRIVVAAAADGLIYRIDLQSQQVQILAGSRAVEDPE